MPRITEALLAQLQANDPALQELRVEFDAHLTAQERNIEIGHLCLALETNNSLKTLYLNDGALDDKSAGLIADYLKTNSVLECLFMEGNPIGRAGQKHIAEALKTNATLRALSLKGLKTGVVGPKHIAEALAVNNTLCELIGLEDSLKKTEINACLERNKQIALSKRAVMNEAHATLPKIKPIRSLVDALPLELHKAILQYSSDEDVKKLSSASVQNDTDTARTFLDDARAEALDRLINWAKTVRTVRCDYVFNEEKTFSNIEQQMTAYMSWAKKEDVLLSFIRHGTGSVAKAILLDFLAQHGDPNKRAMRTQAFNLYNQSLAHLHLDGAIQAARLFTIPAPTSAPAVQAPIHGTPTLSAQTRAINGLVNAVNAPLNIVDNATTITIPQWYSSDVLLADQGFMEAIYALRAVCFTPSENNENNINYDRKVLCLERVLKQIGSKIKFYRDILELLFQSSQDMRFSSRQRNRFLSTLDKILTEHINTDIARESWYVQLMKNLAQTSESMPGRADIDESGKIVHYLLDNCLAEPWFTVCARKWSENAKNCDYLCKLLANYSFKSPEYEAFIAQAVMPGLMGIYQKYQSQTLGDALYRYEKEAIPGHILNMLAHMPVETYAHDWFKAAVETLTHGGQRLTQGIERILELAPREILIKLPYNVIIAQYISRLTTSATTREMNSCIHIMIPFLVRPDAVIILTAIQQDKATLTACLKQKLEACIADPHSYGLFSIQESFLRMETSDQVEWIAMAQALKEFRKNPALKLNSGAPIAAPSIVVKSGQASAAAVITPKAVLDEKNTVIHEPNINFVRSLQLDSLDKQSILTELTRIKALQPNVDSIPTHQRGGPGILVECYRLLKGLYAWMNGELETAVECLEPDFFNKEFGDIARHSVTRIMVAAIDRDTLPTRPDDDGNDHLILEDSNLDDSDIELYARSLSNNNHYTVLDLSDNNISDTGALYLAGMIKQNRALKSLDLSRHALTNVGAQHIADALKDNTTICRLTGLDETSEHTRIQGYLQRNQNLLKKTPEVVLENEQMTSSYDRMVTGLISEDHGASSASDDVSIRAELDPHRGGDDNNTDDVATPTVIASETVTSADEVVRNNIQTLLNAYINRIKGGAEDRDIDFGRNLHGFFGLGKNSMAINRMANYELAKELVRKIQDDTPLNEIFSSWDAIKAERIALMAKNRPLNNAYFLKNNHGMNSDELNKVITLGLGAATSSPRP